MTSEDSRVSLLFAIDGGYAMPLACALWSAVSRCRLPVDAWVIDGGLTCADRVRLAEVVRRARADSRLRFLPAPASAFAEMVTPGHLTRATYLRLLLGELLPRDVRRVIYLDSDLVVLGDLSEVWDLPSEGSAIWAARDQMEPIWGEVPGARVACATMRWDVGTPYFNAGVMAVDCEAWRALDIAGRVTEYTNRHAGDITHGDQDGLNVVFAGRWSELPAEWNVQMAAWFRSKEVYDRGEILHFTGVGKPWNPGYRHERDAATHFFAVLRKSGWLSTGELAAFGLTRRLPQRAIAMAIAGRNRFLGKVRGGGCRGGLR